MLQALGTGEMAQALGTRRDAAGVGYWGGGTGIEYWGRWCRRYLLSLLLPLPWVPGEMAQARSPVPVTRTASSAWRELIPPRASNRDTAREAPVTAERHPPPSVSPFAGAEDEAPCKPCCSRGVASCGFVTPGQCT